MRLKMCTYPGCDCLVSNGSHCSTHKPKKNEFGFNGQRTKSAEWNILYKSARWRNARKEFLKSHPYCYICGESAKIVDHIRPHRGNIDLFYDEENFQSMCWSCHSKKTLKENNFFNGGGVKKTRGNNR